MLIRSPLQAPDFPCTCCGQGKITDGLRKALEELDALVGGRLEVISGCRCAKHNREVGGSPTSRHLAGDAADFCVEGMHPRDLAAFADQVEGFHLGGIGVYADGHVHGDCRKGMQSRWVG